MRLLRILGAIVIAAVTLVALPNSLLQAAPAAQENLLLNPDFEGAFLQFAQFGTAIVAEQWLPWWKAQTPGDELWQNRMPEFKPAAPYQNRIFTGQNAQQLFTFYGTHVGGLYQTVGGITPGSTVRFTIWGQAWSGDGDDPSYSLNPSPMHRRIGIDPNGGADPWSGSIVWSPEQDTFDAWSLFSVEATVNGSTATVFTWSSPDFPSKHNDVYWDAASLMVVTGASPTATPTVPPTATPTHTPTATPTNTPTATPTNTPTATPTNTPTATPTLLPTATAANQPTATPTHTPTATPTNQPTAAPTSTPTAMPTLLPTATPTHTPTPNIIGRITLQGRTDHQGTILTSAMGPHTTTDQTGHFGLYYEGEIDLYIRHPGYLDAITTVNAVAGTELDVGEIVLLGGDVNGDNIIDILDFAYIGYRFGTTDARADLNSDGPSIASKTRCWVSSDIGELFFTLPLRTYETVARDTPARLATSA